MTSKHPNFQTSKLSNFPKIALLAAALVAGIAALGAERGLGELPAVLSEAGRSGGERLAAAERLVAHWEAQPGFAAAHRTELGRAYLALYRATRRERWLEKAKASGPEARAAAEEMSSGVAVRLDHSGKALDYVSYPPQDVALTRPDETDPDGGRCVTFTMLTGPTAVAHGKQIRFQAETALSADLHYRLSYWIKANRDGQSAFAQLALPKAPWTNYGGPSGAITTEWKRHTVLLRVERDVPRQMLSVPFLMPGFCPKGYSFTMGPIVLERVAPEELCAGAEWRPVDMPATPLRYFEPTRLPALEVKRGTALDLSQYLPREDIDANGRLVADAQGRLVAEGAPGRTIRLRGFNCTYGSSFDKFADMEKPEIVELADQIVRAGCNVVRLHFWDSKFVGLGGMKWYPLRDTEMEEAGIPQSEEALRRTLDAAFVDRYHWFMKCLRDRGVYVMFDIATSAAMMARARKASAYPRVQLFLNPVYRNHWKAAYGVWMNTVNPYTGKRPLDDPQYVAITFYNEQEHIFNPAGGAQHLAKLTPAFRAACGTDLPELTMALLRAEGAAGDKARAFMRSRIAEMNAFYLSVVKASGYRGFVTNWDMYMRNLEGDARKTLSAVAMHPYHCHPGHADLPPGFVSARAQSPWQAGQAQTTGNASSIVSNGYLAHAAMTRVLGKPFFLTEFSHCGGNRYASEAPVVQSAAAALQDWQMLAPHANLVMLYHYDGFEPFCFDNAASLMARVASVATAFGWQRGDVASAPHAVEVAVPERDLRGPRYTATIGCAYNTLAWLTRIGAGYSGRTNTLADLTLTPTCYAVAASLGMWAKVQEETEANVPVCAENVAILRQRGILPAGNRTDVASGVFESETGEVLTNLRRGTMSVDAPRFQAAALKPGQTARLSALDVTRVTVPSSILAISLEKDRSVKASRHLLLIVATQFAAEGSVWQESVWNDQMLESGGYRQLVRAGRFDFSLKATGIAKPKVHALRLDGTRGEEVAVRQADGRLVFNLDTARLKYGTPYFEIVDADGGNPQPETARAR